MKNKWLVLGGLFCGTVFSLFRFSSMVAVYAKILSQEAKQAAVAKSVLNYVVSLVVVIALLVISMKISMSMFTGMTAGILLVPAVFFINAITEGFGITHNNFE
ncbi:MAG: hypothetical protein QHH06_07505 [Clostridiales bacterium]|nr:hypothetical protein [Eubacteriales bacterium]MDH7566313.1 hypothetical protein [Clostridiales bacterium]